MLSQNQPTAEDNDHSSQYCISLKTQLEVFQSTIAEALPLL